MKFTYGKMKGNQINKKQIPLDYIFYTCLNPPIFQWSCTHFTVRALTHTTDLSIYMDSVCICVWEREKGRNQLRGLGDTNLSKGMKTVVFKDLLQMGRWDQKSHDFSQDKLLEFFTQLKFVSRKLY